MKKRTMDRIGKLIKLFMDRDLGSILLWQCNGSIEQIDRNFFDARNNQMSKTRLGCFGVTAMLS